LWSLSFTGLGSFLGSKKGKIGAKIAKRNFFCSFCTFLPFLLPEKERLPQNPLLKTKNEN
jgi:hypothetical protein